MSVVKFSLVRAEAIPPRPDPKHAGVTLHACFGLNDFAPQLYKRPPIAGAERTLALASGQSLNIPTGIAVELNERHFGLIVERPDATPHTDLVVEPAIVDPGRRTELYVRVWFAPPYKDSRSTYYLNTDDPLARLVVVQHATEWVQA